MQYLITVVAFSLLIILNQFLSVQMLSKLAIKGKQTLRNLQLFEKQKEQLWIVANGAMLLIMLFVFIQ